MDPKEQIQSSEELRLSAGLNKKRFATFARDFFYGFANKDNSYLYFIKDSALLKYFNMPGALGELLMSPECAPYFWLCDTPLLIKLEQHITQETKRRADRRDEYLIIKEYYSKWAAMKSAEGKKLNAVSALRSIENDSNKKNILKYFIQAALLIFEKSVANPSRAHEILDTLQLPEAFKLPEELASETIYYALIMKIILLIQEGDYYQALDCCDRALAIHPDGINVKFYEALAATYLDDKGHAIEAISTIIKTDTDRIVYAVENNKIPIFSYVLQSATTYSLFTGGEFASLLQHLQPLLEKMVEGIEFSFDNLNEKLEMFAALDYKEYYTPEVKDSLIFLVNVCRQYYDTKNYFILISMPILKQKFNSILDKIISRISEVQFSQISSRMSNYDVEVIELKGKIDFIEKEQANFKNVEKEKLANDLERIQKAAADAISAIERQIEEMPLKNEFSPQAVFNNSMIYNYIISSIIFVIGGFSGCYSGSSGLSENFNSAIGLAAISGLKWSAITFLIGLIISAAMGAFSIVDRNNEKQSLIRRISLIKNKKERESEKLKKASEAKEKSFMEAFVSKVKILKDHLMEITTERQNREDELRTDIQASVDEHASRILELTIK